MEIKEVYVKTRAEFGRQCIFDDHGPKLDVSIKPSPDEMNDYIVRSHCHVGVHHSRQLALHEVQTESTSFRNSGMFHLEGGWPKEINPRDEEATARFRRRVEKDDDWAPKLRNLFEMTEQSVLQNSAMNIYQHYFDDMIPTAIAQSYNLRTVNIYADPATPTRPVNNISWSPDSGSRIVVSYCFLEFGRQPDYSNTVYIWQVENPNKPYMALEPFCPSMVNEFNPRDPSVLASGLMSGQVCSWDTRTGMTPVQLSQPEFSHRDYTNGIKWIPTKSNTEFFSTSSDGRALWWDMRNNLQTPTEVLVFDLENPNEPNIDRAIGVSCLNFGPMVGTKFMFGMENGIVISGSRKSKTNAEKLSLRYEGHNGPVVSVDCNVFNPSIFLSVGDWTARIWAEDTREGCLLSTPFQIKQPTGGCWNKLNYSIFNVITANGFLTVWDILQDLRKPIRSIQLCKQKLTTIAPQEEGPLLAIGNSNGMVYLVESTESLQSFDKKQRGTLSEYFERCSRYMKAVDGRIREIKLALAMAKKVESDQKIKRSKASHKPSVSKKPHRASQRTSKERSRRSVPWDKKKVKDESPELAEAEERYFEIIEKEKAQYISKADSAMDPAWFHLHTSKRHETKKPNKKSSSTPEEKKAKDTDPSTQKKLGKAKIEKPKSKAGVDQRGAERKTTVGDSIVSLKVDTKMARQSAKDISRRQMKKKKRRVQRRMKIKIPIPCKGEVCRPKVCCWRNVRKRKSKPGKENRMKDGTKLRDQEEEMERKRSSQRSEKESSRRETVEQESERKRKGAKMSVGDKSEKSLSMLMDRFGSEERTTRYSNEKRIRILREMLALPLVLEVEVKRAKGEIREASWMTEKARRRYIVERILESRAQQKSEEGKSRKFKEELDKISKIHHRKQAVSRGRLTRSRKSPSPTYDPCTPRDLKSITEDFADFLDVPMPKSMEIKSKGGKAYLEELEASRSGVYYPRISEFHSIE